MVTSTYILDKSSIAKAHGCPGSNSVCLSEVLSTEESPTKTLFVLPGNANSVDVERAASTIQQLQPPGQRTTVPVTRVGLEGARPARPESRKLFSQEIEDALGGYLLPEADNARIQYVVNNNRQALSIYKL